MGRDLIKNRIWRKDWLKKNPEKRIAYNQLNKKWFTKHPAKWSEYSKRHRDKVRLEVFLHYSKDGKIKCSACGFDNIEALSLDHINENGAKHRKETSGSKMGGINFYKYIRSHGYPEDLQVLCMNCNIIKQKQYLKNNSKYNGSYIPS